jgi:hypothetical protein
MDTAAGRPGSGRRSDSDEVGQRGDIRSIRGCQAVAEAIPERDAQLVAGGYQPEETVPAVTSAVADGAAGELAEGDLAADVVLLLVGEGSKCRSVCQASDVDQFLSNHPGTDS